VVCKQHTRIFEAPPIVPVAMAPLTADALNAIAAAISAPARTPRPPVAPATTGPPEAIVAEATSLCESLTNFEPDGELPPLVRSSLVLALDGKTTTATTAETDDARQQAPGLTDAISFWHLAKNDGGVFSSKKRQCALWENVWGCSLLFSRIVHSWFARVKHQHAALVHQGTHQGTHTSVALPKVLNIGGGLGVTSLAALASDGVSGVVMTDLVLDALRIFNKSLGELNETRRNKCEMRTLDWNKPDTVPECAFDVVIACDVLFGRWCVKPVADAVARALKPGGVALVADPCRLNEEDFAERVSELGLSARVIELSTDLVASVGELAVEKDGIVPVQRCKLVIISKPAKEVVGSDSRDLNVPAELSALLGDSLETTLAAIPCAK
jgi:SAM-dependent methyltransferase